VNQKEYVMSIGKRITAALGVLSTTAVLFLAGTGAGTANAQLLSVDHNSILDCNNIVAAVGLGLLGQGSAGAQGSQKCVKEAVDLTVG
jgi:hypothetical protein